MGGNDPSSSRGSNSSSDSTLGIDMCERAVNIIGDAHCPRNRKSRFGRSIVSQVCTECTAEPYSFNIFKYKWGRPWNGLDFVTASPRESCVNVGGSSTS